MTDDLIEKMAGAFLKDLIQNSTESWQLDNAAADRAMRAAWAAAAEPNFEMQVAGHKVRGLVPYESVVDIWQAMHGAADVDGER